MTFDFDKNGIKAYIKCLEKRTVEANKRIVQDLHHNLYELTPKRTGCLASNYNISVNGPNYSWSSEKTTPDFTIPTFGIKDQLYITNSVPYIMFVNIGTLKQIGQNFIERAEFKTQMNLPNILKGIDKID